MKSFVAAAVMIALFAALQVAGAQTGNAPFCLKITNGRPNCIYSTMAQCEQARESQSADQCITRTDAAGATGLGDGPITPPSDSPDRKSNSPER